MCVWVVVMLMLLFVLFRSDHNCRVQQASSGSAKDYTRAQQLNMLCTPHTAAWNKICTPSAVSVRPISTRVPSLENQICVAVQTGFISTERERENYLSASAMNNIIAIIGT